MTAALTAQASAGNRAVTAALGHGAGPIVVQRHSSFEHALMGDTEPGRLGDAAVEGRSRRHLLAEQFSRVLFFRTDPRGDPRQRFPTIRWMQLQGSRLWISYGELNALADYLPDADHIDTLPADTVLPVLQRMRRQLSAQIFELGFSGEARAGAYEALPVGGEKAMDNATAGLGANRYMGLLSRNACHFAPFSWQRWASNHEEAREMATAYHRDQHTARPVKDLDVNADARLRQAWLKNGYGDHFLQDSFAAGHLINKTLVMQWFVDYLNSMASRWWDLLGPVVWWGFDNTRPWYGMPSDAVMNNMGTAQQPGMAGRSLYGRRPGTAGASSRTTSIDRGLADDVTDPQTAQERGTRGQRVGGSGVQATRGRSRDDNYQTYLSFLNSSFLQLAAGETHNYFNERGLRVRNGRGDVMVVGGDDTLLTRSGRVGAETAGEASSMSRRAIEEISQAGTTSITVGQISDLFPIEVYASRDDAEPLPLENWQDQVLRRLCFREIFPDVVDSFSSKVARGAQPNLSPSGVALPDGPRAPRPPDPRNFGDWVVPAGGPRRG